MIQCGLLYPTLTEGEKYDKFFSDLLARTIIGSSQGSVQTEVDQTDQDSAELLIFVLTARDKVPQTIAHYVERKTTLQMTDAHTW